MHFELSQFTLDPNQICFVSVYHSAPALLLIDQGNSVLCVDSIHVSVKLASTPVMSPVTH